MKLKRVNFLKSIEGSWDATDPEHWIAELAFRNPKKSLYMWADPWVNSHDDTRTHFFFLFYLAWFIQSLSRNTVALKPIEFQNLSWKLYKACTQLVEPLLQGRDPVGIGFKPHKSSLRISWNTNYPDWFCFSTTREDAMESVQNRIDCGQAKSGTIRHSNQYFNLILGAAYRLPIHIKYYFSKALPIVLPSNKIISDIFLKAVDKPQSTSSIHIPPRTSIDPAGDPTPYPKADQLWDHKGHFFCAWCCKTLHPGEYTWHKVWDVSGAEQYLSKTLFTLPWYIPVHTQEISDTSRDACFYKVSAKFVISLSQRLNSLPRDNSDSSLCDKRYLEQACEDAFYDGNFCLATALREMIRLMSTEREELFRHLGLELASGADCIFVDALVAHIRKEAKHNDVIRQYLESPEGRLYWATMLLVAEERETSEAIFDSVRSDPRLQKPKYELLHNRLARRDVFIYHNQDTAKRAVEMAEGEMTRPEDNPYTLRTALTGSIESGAGAKDIKTARDSYETALHLYKYPMNIWQLGLFNVAMGVITYFDKRENKLNAALTEIVAALYSRTLLGLYTHGIPIPFLGSNKEKSWKPSELMQNIASLHGVTDLTMYNIRRKVIIEGRLRERIAEIFSRTRLRTSAMEGLRK